MSILLNVEIEDNDIAKAVDKLFEDFKHRAERGVWAACMDTAEYIRSTYTGGLKGFKDRTGQLRRSIKGGLNEVTDNEISGFIGAGDERIGSDGKATKDYALFVISVSKAYVQTGYSFP